MGEIKGEENGSIMGESVGIFDCFVRISIKSYC